jgi:hypothetical protein
MICLIMKPFYEPLIQNDRRKSAHHEIEDRSGAASPELERIPRDTGPIYDENGAIEGGATAVREWAKPAKTSGRRSLLEWGYAKPSNHAAERALLPFRPHYNYHRPHFGIDGCRYRKDPKKQAIATRQLVPKAPWGRSMARLAIDGLGSRTRHAGQHSLRPSA